MDAPAEREVPDVGPGHVEAERVVVLVGVEVGGGEEEHDELPGRDREVGDHEVLVRDARREDDRRVVTQALLDRVGDQ